jgi:peptidoglycan/LPS O-acetylase OafA/YrhL
LVHFPVIAVVYGMLVGSGLLLVLPGWLIMAALAAASAFAGVGLHLVAERPALRRSIAAARFARVNRGRCALP